MPEPRRFRGRKAAIRSPGAVTRRPRIGAGQEARAAGSSQATAAVTTISIFHSGLASAACTVARGGV